LYAALWQRNRLMHQAHTCAWQTPAPGDNSRAGCTRAILTSAPMPQSSRQHNHHGWLHTPNNRQPEWSHRACIANPQAGCATKRNSRRQQCVQRCTQQFFKRTQLQKGRRCEAQLRHYKMHEMNQMQMRRMQRTFQQLATNDRIVTDHRNEATTQQSEQRTMPDLSEKASATCQCTVRDIACASHVATDIWYMLLYWPLSDGCLTTAVNQR
ncbi:hypothetical protein COO60DRAFT_1532774, partial [Scenedesmus sp. NREL 46B-D3]